MYNSSLERQRQSAHNLKVPVGPCPGATSAQQVPGAAHRRSLLSFLRRPERTGHLATFLIKPPEPGHFRRRMAV